MTLIGAYLYHTQNTSTYGSQITGVPLNTPIMLLLNVTRVTTRPRFLTYKLNQ